MKDLDAEIKLKIYSILNEATYEKEVLIAGYGETIIAAFDKDYAVNELLKLINTKK